MYSLIIFKNSHCYSTKFSLTKSLTINGKFNLLSNKVYLNQLFFLKNYEGDYKMK